MPDTKQGPAGPSYRISPSVRSWWELEKPKGGRLAAALAGEAFLLANSDDVDQRARICRLIRALTKFNRINRADLQARDRAARLD